MMREYQDVSNRLSFNLSDDCTEFDFFAKEMILLYKQPIQKIESLMNEQRYWDFKVDEVVIVLHSDIMTGVSIYVENGNYDRVLRNIVRELRRKKRK
jgi:hypothetical protein